MLPYKYISDPVNANGWKNIVDKRLAYLNNLEDENLSLPAGSPQYDNTIYYTDAVLSEIFKKFEDTKSLFIYVSDHAEVVHLNKTGHGHVPT